MDWWSSNCVLSKGEEGGLTTALPPTPNDTYALWRVKFLKPKPLQNEVLRALSQVERSSVKGLASDLKRDRRSIQRCLERLKDDGEVHDVWCRPAPWISPKIIAHYHSLPTHLKSKTEHSSSDCEEVVEEPLGFRILRLFSNFQCFTVGSVSKLLKKHHSQVRKVLKTLHRHGLVDYTEHKTGRDPDSLGKICFWFVNDEGRTLAGQSVKEYDCVVRRRRGGIAYRHRVS